VPQNNPKSHKPTLEKEDYERLGQDLELLVATGYAGKRRMMWANFLRGLFFGLGTTIGVSLAIALFLWILNIADEVEFLRPAAEDLQHTIEQRK
jgi:hypothetical protein